MRHALTLTAMLCLIALPAFAEWDVDGIEELLPIDMTSEEVGIWPDYVAQNADRISDPPPLAPVRNVAEWEPSSGVLIRYPLGLPYGLLQDFDDDVTLHVVVSSSNQSSAQSNLSANGVDMGKVQFLVKNSDSIWTRDYGPWYVFDGAGDVAIIDHTYNRPRPNDNLIPVYFGEQQGIPVHSHDMYHTGGNYMTDGMHFSCSTRLVYNEASTYNGMNQAQVDQLMLDYYGVENYYVLDYIESGGIHHIDTWAKFLDEETVLVKEVWSSHGTYNTLNQRATLLASLPSSTGRNYRVYRVYCYSTSSGPASYTNSLILNDKIYVPFFGNSGYDNDAIAAYAEAAPGYELEGYYYSGFLSDDALHCRAKAAYDVGMLRVEHAPYRDGEPVVAPVVITAKVDDRSEAGVSLVEFHYRFNEGIWLVEPMTYVGGDNYETVLPAPVGPRDVVTQVDYYIHAEDYSGRAEGMPRPEPAAWYTFNMEYQTGVDTPLAGPVRLHANYPNPFNPKTTFSFELEYADQVTLEVFDASGRLVRTLIDGECPAGPTEVQWNGTDASGRELSSGVYFYRLRAAGIQYSRPAVLAK